MTLKTTLQTGLGMCSAMKCLQIKYQNWQKIRKRRLKIHGIARFPRIPLAEDLMDKNKIRISNVTPDPEIYNGQAELWEFQRLMPYSGTLYGIIDPQIFYEVSDIVETVVRNRKRFKLLHVPGTREKA